MDQQQRERFASGDRAVLRDVYREYGRSLYALAYRVLGDHGMSEEAVQAAMLNAWRHCTTFDPGRELGPWLYTIARRAAIDIYRREQRHRSADVVDADIAVLPRSLDEIWQAWQVQEALVRLPEAEREIVRCTHYLGLTHEETAERLGIPVGTVKSRSHRAYRRLAAMLDHLREMSA